VLNMAIRARASAEDWDGALALARTSAAPVQAGLWLAERLVEHGEVVDAGSLLPDDCAQLEPGLDGQCAVLRARVGGR
jgi:hypothetical protein